MIKSVYTEKAAQPSGHYSQAIVHNGLVYVSGQLPIHPYTQQVIEEDIKAQTLQTLQNVEAILQEAGTDRHRVLKATVYITDLSLWGPMNEVYGSFFGNHKPARAAVPVKELRKGCQIEIEVIAAIE